MLEHLWYICHIFSFCKPWITHGIRKSIKVKEKVYKRYIETRNPYHLTKFKLYRNKITCLLRNSKQNYCQTYFLENNKNIKKTWEGIKELVTLKPTGFRLPTKIISNNITLNDSSEIASTFNRHFSLIGSKLAENISSVNINTLSFLSTPLQNSFSDKKNWGCDYLLKYFQVIYNLSFPTCAWPVQISQCCTNP